ncbi:hypothetical protein EVAR_76733_1 [Eumeta japonica]|uniref:Uncharacterized protein n=1 Tax=Eumeta variegata TaxID=151549 RepID=A0A4C1SSR9_EUMVA|nr:hypothetical protein EVAR_76733_1 [Eumeta japonica]
MNTSGFFRGNISYSHSNLRSSRTELGCLALSITFAENCELSPDRLARRGSPITNFSTTDNNFQSEQTSRARRLLVELRGDGCSRCYQREEAIPARAADEFVNASEILVWSRLGGYYGAEPEPEGVEARKKCKCGPRKIMGARTARAPLTDKGAPATPTRTTFGN